MLKSLLRRADLRVPAPRDAQDSRLPTSRILLCRAAEVLPRRRSPGRTGALRRRVQLVCLASGRPATPHV